jgi:hypothetical protein
MERRWRSFRSTASRSKVHDTLQAQVVEREWNTLRRFSQTFPTGLTHRADKGVMNATQSLVGTKFACEPLLREPWKVSTKRVIFITVGVVLLAVGVVCFQFYFAGMPPAPVSDFANAAGAPAARFVIAPCSTPVTGGKASLVIGSLQGKDETYVGNYELKVTPYFFMNETGSLSMTLPMEAARKLDQGLPVAATGQAVTKKNGKTRKVNATLTPTTKDADSVTFAFTGESTNLIFKSTYTRGSK